jgi:hypothetical protein
MAKIVRRGFVSYARYDTLLVERFLHLMRPRCSTLREFELDWWSDQQIAVGKPWEREIESAIETADFGLFCVTPSFLDSAYAIQRELPRFLDRGRVLFPVALEPVDLARADLKGLEALQIFRYRQPTTVKQHSFAECSAINRARFCDALVAQMTNRLTAVGAG